MANLYLANFERPVLGCIDAKFCKKIVLNTRLKGLDEIYKIYTLLHRSAFKISAKFRQTFSHFHCLIFKAHAGGAQDAEAHRGDDERTVDLIGTPRVNRLRRGGGRGYGIMRKLLFFDTIFG